MIIKLLKSKRTTVSWFWQQCTLSYNHDFWELLQYIKIPLHIQTTTIQVHYQQQCGFHTSHYPIHSLPTTLDDVKKLNQINLLLSGMQALIKTQNQNFLVLTTEGLWFTITKVNRSHTKQQTVKSTHFNYIWHVQQLSKYKHPWCFKNLFY